MKPARGFAWSYFETMNRLGIGEQDDVGAEDEIVALLQRMTAERDAQHEQAAQARIAALEAEQVAHIEIIHRNADKRIAEARAAALRDALHEFNQVAAASDRQAIPASRFMAALNRVASMVLDAEKAIEEAAKR